LDYSRVEVAAKKAEKTGTSGKAENKEKAILIY